MSGSMGSIRQFWVAHVAVIVAVSDCIRISLNDAVGTCDGFTDDARYVVRCSRGQRQPMTAAVGRRSRPADIPREQTEGSRYCVRRRPASHRRFVRFDTGPKVPNWTGGGLSLRPMSMIVSVDGLTVTLRYRPVGSG